jgi:hypothetical protein
MGDHGSASDGRLELDDLGGIIDRSTSLDSPGSAPTDLVEGVESPSLAERMESAGLTPWLRRHRFSVAAASAVCVLAAAAGTTYVRTRPAPVDPSIEVAIADVNPGTPATSDQFGGPMQFPYRLTPAHPTDRVRVLGLVGPGIRASRASSADGPNDVGVVFSTVYVLPGCDDTAIATPRATGYQLRVERTNAAGQMVEGLVDLPLSSSAQWPTQILSACLQQWLEEEVTTERISITTDPASFSLTINAAVRNDLAHDLVVNTYDQGGSTYVTSAGGVLSAHSVTTLPLTFTVNDCSTVRWDYGHDPNTGAAFAGMPLFVSLLDPAVSSENLAPGLIRLRWDQATEHTVEASLKALCAGAPRATWSVRSSARATDPVFERNARDSGVDTPVLLRSVLRLQTTATHVRLTDGQNRGYATNGPLPLVRTVSAAVRGGRATLTVDWLASCSGSNPPQAQLALTSGGREWPVLIPLDSPVIVQAYLAACPTLTYTDLESLQWSVQPADPGVVPVSSQ